MAEDPCPSCGEPLEFDEVDIGVGVQRGNPHCRSCGWYPEHENDHPPIDEEQH